MCERERAGVEKSEEDRVRGEKSDKEGERERERERGGKYDVFLKSILYALNLILFYISLALIRAMFSVNRPRGCGQPLSIPPAMGAGLLRIREG